MIWYFEQYLGWTIPAWVTLLCLYLLAEVLHHYWAIAKVRAIDQLYANSKLDRDVDVVDHPPVDIFSEYFDSCSPDFVKHMRMWSASVGADLDEMIQRASEKHISEDFAAFIDPGHCVPMTLWFRTMNTIRLWQTGRFLKKQGFQGIYMSHVHLYYYHKPAEPKRPLLVIFPQFSGEFRKLAVFSELRHMYDVLFVGPLGTQCSWWFKASRHTDALEQYLPFILRHDKVSVVSWSAGNVLFQILDRYLELRNQRHRIQTVIRMDPLGYPASNFLIFTGVLLPLMQLKDKFIQLCTEHTPSNKPVKLSNLLGCFGFAYLLKSVHGFAYLKLGRMLRATKLACAPYPEHHFAGNFDPCWCLDHPTFNNDSQLLCSNVVEHSVEGFHGLWVNPDMIRTHVFPILINNTFVSVSKN
jgi:hypothetical protein